MRDVTIRVVPPALADLQTAACLIRAGGAVQAKGLEARIARAFRIATMHTATGYVVPVSIAAIKCPDAGYVARVAHDAEVPALRDAAPLEYGWAFTMPQMRALGCVNALTAALLVEVAARPLYAVTANCNLPMHRCLVRHGFTEAGKRWQSLRSEGTILSLYTRGI